MTRKNAATVRCAIYSRKSSEEGLEQEFNSLHAQREACEAYIQSQKHEGWTALPQHYDDGGIPIEPPGRSGQYADDILHGFSGILQVDGYLFHDGQGLPYITKSCKRNAIAINMAMVVAMDRSVQLSHFGLMIDMWLRSWLNRNHGRVCTKTSIETPIHFK